MFGSNNTPTTNATSIFGLFGTATAAPSTVGLFGSSSAAPQPSVSGSSFGANPATTTTTTTTTSSTTFGSGLFGSTMTHSAPATTGGLFGTTTSTVPSTTAPLSLNLSESKATTASSTATGGLFGANPTTTTKTASGGLFGSATTSAAPSSGSLFGSTVTTTSTPATVGLFGTRPVTTPAITTLGGGLFGSSTSTATTASPFAAVPTSITAPLGLGGVQQQNSGGKANTSGNATSSVTRTGEKDASKDGEWTQVSTLMRDMLPLIEEQLKKNRELIEETENLTVDNVSIEEMIDRTRGCIEKVRRDISAASESAANIGYLVSTDKELSDTAKRFQEQSSTANQGMHVASIKQHLLRLCELYDYDMRALQCRVTFLRNRFEKLLKGEPSLTVNELDECFRKCDTTVSNGHQAIEQLGKEIDEVRDYLIEQGYTQLRKWNTHSNAAHHNTVDPAMAVSEGAEFFPSQSSLAIIGSSLRAPSAPAPAVGGLSLGAGTSLFGNTGGSSLFGSNTTKPAFSGGSLFGSTSSATSSAGATAPTTSLFGSKPATTTPFASTVANNSSGLLFSSKK